MDTLESFYRAHYRVVYRYLLSLCGNRSVAEDLASETFLRAIRHIERYDGTCKPTTWLCQIGKNLWLNECRRQRRLVPLEDALEAALPSPEDALAGREARRPDAAHTAAAGLLNAAGGAVPPGDRRRPGSKRDLGPGYFFSR